MDRTRFLNKALCSGFTVNHCFDALLRYSALMIEYNKKINLTRILDTEDIEDKHFIDCLTVVYDERMTGKVCDVGSGAGFPGLVAAIARPELQVTLLEPTGKRCVFLSEVAKELQLSNITVLNGRAEDIAHNPQYRESFDTVTARAVAALPTLLEYCLPLCKTGGHVLAMKGTTESTADGRRAAKILGADAGKTVQYTLPRGDERALFVYEKVSKTPKEYPRNGGRISKAPLG